MAIRKILTRAIDSTASSSNLNIDANTLFIDTTNNRVGIGSASPASKLVVNGASGAVALNVTNVSVDGSSADVVQIEPSNGAYYGKLLKITSGRSDYSDSLLFLNTSTGMNGTNGSYLRVQNSASADIFRIKGDGTVGIGVTAPVNKLEVSGAIVATGAAAGYSAGMTLVDYASGNSNITAIGSNTSTVGTTVFQAFSSNASLGGERMRIDASGNLVVGATSTRGTYKLDIRSDTSIALGSNATYFGTIGYSAGTGLLSLAAESGGGINFLSGATERMRINSSGNVGIGTASPTSKLDVNGTFKVTDASGNGIVLYGAYGDSFGGNASAVIFAGDPGAGGGWYFWKCVADYNGTPDTRAFLHSNGGLYNFSANNSNLSDFRVKRDIALAGSYLDKICAIPVKTFKYKSQTLPEDQEATLGVIAQDVEAIAPELVNVTGFGDTPEDGIPLKAIYQTDLQYALMKCIQEQQVLIAQLQADVAALQAK